MMGQGNQFHTLDWRVSQFLLVYLNQKETKNETHLYIFPFFMYPINITTLMGRGQKRPPNVQYAAVNTLE